MSSRSSSLWLLMVCVIWLSGLLFVLYGGGVLWIIWFWMLSVLVIVVVMLFVLCGVSLMSWILFGVWWLVLIVSWVLLVLFGLIRVISWVCLSVDVMVLMFGLCLMNVVSGTVSVAVG